MRAVSNKRFYSTLYAMDKIQARGFDDLSSSPFFITLINR